MRKCDWSCQQILVQCYKCNGVIKVETSSKRASNRYYDSNLKLAISTIDAGLGETKLNTFISGLNIPAINASSLKKWERYVGTGIEKLAQTTCIAAIKEEKRLTLELKKQNNEEVDENEITDLTGSFDCAWPKKGRQYNSLSGHASLISLLSKKVMAWACRNIYCRQCKRVVPGNHICRRNHNGSSKAIEADMAVELILKNEHLVKLKCRIKTLIADDDSSAIAALRRPSPYAIEKWSDFNHSTKTFNGCEPKVKDALSNIVPHAFGDHQNCGTFCQKNDKNQHVYRYFKDGQCLTDLNLKDKLEKPYINSVAQLAPCASSQANESFNNTNIGYTFIVELNVSLNLSPGKHTENFRKRKQEYFETNIQKKQTIPAKKIRLILKKERSTQNVSTTNREGVTYQSGAGYLDTSDLIDEVVIADQATYEDCCIVTFDTETTGLLATDEIVQIAAACDSNIFEVYILPKKEMPSAASNITGIRIIGNEMYIGGKIDENQTYVGGQKVVTYSAREGFLSFLHFLKLQKKPCILLAHNGFRFDAPRIIKLATSLHLINEMNLFVKGFSDTLSIFKSILVDKKKEKKSFSQSSLADDLLAREDVMVAHNALNDVLMLPKLVGKICKNNTPIIERTQSINFIQDKKKLNEAKKIRGNTLSDLTITKHMKNKIAKAGIDKNILKKACENGLEGVTMLLGMSVNGKPRVTMNKKIVKCIFNDMTK
ncbi:uncharacterized protein LOC131666934 [Phymastichus coffea]|uniref:uncharacterized protein LOC131666934 n=1 Tax=Phymastichus coffea TaxID=108790 RepID=UPI00273CB981|nr:uncharacterized protein LOC131666934 [Phymastichus coffea]